LRKWLAALMVATLLAACGGDDGENGEGGGTGLEACADDAPAGVEISGEAGVPADFPFPDGMVVTGVEEAGPSIIVHGYYDGGLEDAYEAWQGSIEDGGYEVAGSEIEAEFHESEVGFKGGGSEGQVKLVEECEGRTDVRITIRPEG
jgi:hypothetical protein